MSDRDDEQSAFEAEIEAQWVRVRRGERARVLRELRGEAARHAAGDAFVRARVVAVNFSAADLAEIALDAAASLLAPEGRAA